MDSTIATRVARSLLILACSTSIGLISQAGYPSDDPPAKSKEEVAVEEELRRLDGEWRVERTNFPVRGAGELSAEEAEEEGLKWAIKDGVATPYRAGKALRPMPIVVYPEDKPKTIDLLITIPNRTTPPLVGIYELDGDKLRLRYATKTRPASFEEPPAKGEYDWVLIRRNP